MPRSVSAAGPCERAATCSRHGVAYFEIEGTIGEAIDAPLTFEEHLFCYKGMPSIDTPGQFDGEQDQRTDQNDDR